MENVNFKFGEKKYVCIGIRSCGNHPFEVTRARFELRCGEETEASGECEISRRGENEIILSSLLEPLRKNAAYRLSVTYDIPPEVLKHEILVNVY